MKVKTKDLLTLNELKKKRIIRNIRKCYKTKERS